jgi:flagellar biogenesis protein FliO
VNGYDETGEGPDPQPTTGMPRWVKVFLIIAIVLVVAFVVSRLLGIQHGPGLHM